MSFNPTKCEFLHITNKKTPLIHSYYIATPLIKEVTSIKYLGVQIDNKLTWNDHIQYITHKAAQVNGFLYRNLRQCPPYIKTACYKSMVHPILEYTSSVWDPHTNVNIQKLEPVQRRAARFCLGDYSRYSSVRSMLLLLDLPSLQFRRKLAKLTTMYKLINGNLHNIIPFNSLTPNHRDSRDGYSCNYSVEQTLINFLFSSPPLSYGTPSPLYN